MDRRNAIETAGKEKVDGQTQSPKHDQIKRGAIMSSNRWTPDQLKLAFHLYCQLPFGKLHSRNSEITELAQLIGRTPSAVAMKLVNFASLDPAITSTGRRGLGNASHADRSVWDEFHANWDGLVEKSASLRLSLSKKMMMIKKSLSQTRLLSSKISQAKRELLLSSNVSSKRFFDVPF